MPNAHSTRTPSYRKHKATGQAVVTLSGKDPYLGRYGTAASKREHDRLLGGWLACLRRRGKGRMKGKAWPREGGNTGNVGGQVPCPCASLEA